MGSGIAFAVTFIIVTAAIVSFSMFIWKPRRKLPVRKHDRTAPENDLERSIASSSSLPTRSEETMSRIKGSRLLVLGSLSDGKKIALKHWEIGGLPVIPAFTSIVRLRESISHQEHYIEMDAYTFFKSIPGNSDVVLNPNTEFTLELKHGTITKLLEEGNHKGTEAQG